jgi:hypothetical protein
MESWCGHDGEVARKSGEPRVLVYEHFKKTNQLPFLVPQVNISSGRFEYGAI